jgi:hypothetical protein
MTLSSSIRKHSDIKILCTARFSEKLFRKKLNRTYLIVIYKEMQENKSDRLLSQVKWSTELTVLKKNTKKWFGPNFFFQDGKSSSHHQWRFQEWAGKD